MFDILLFFDYLEYFETTFYVSSMNDTQVINETQDLFGGARDWTCTFINTTEQGHQFLCEELHPWFAILTLLFIYLPSVNVLATLYGPKTAGRVAMWEGPILIGLGTTMACLTFGAL